MIIRNAIECKWCGAVIESKHRHDFVQHTCVQNNRTVDIAVDGGRAYLKRMGDLDDWIERSEFNGRGDV